MGQSSINIINTLESWINFPGGYEYIQILFRMTITILIFKAILELINGVFTVVIKALK